MSIALLGRQGRVLLLGLAEVPHPHDFFTRDFFYFFTYASDGAKLCGILPPPPPKFEDRGGGPLEGGGTTSLVRHHRASLWLPSFSEACMKAASLQPRVSLPETWGALEGRPLSL